MTQEMTAYYARRAAEYERIYTGPRWQDDLARLRPRVTELFAGRRVFEVACGTGYWTHVAAERARAVHATDLNDDTLAIARAKSYTAPVSFERRDAYAPAAGPVRFDAGLAGLWLSHVDLARMDEFLRAFHSHLEPGARGADVRRARHRGARRPRRSAASTRRATATRCGASRTASASRSSRTSSIARAWRRWSRPHAASVSYRELQFFWLLEYAVA